MKRHLNASQRTEDPTEPVSVAKHNHVLFFFLMGSLMDLTLSRGQGSSVQTVKSCNLVKDAKTASCSYLFCLESFPSDIEARRAELWTALSAGRTCLCCQSTQQTHYMKTYEHTVRDMCGHVCMETDTETEVTEQNCSTEWSLKSKILGPNLSGRHSGWVVVGCWHLVCAHLTCKWVRTANT